MFRKNYVPALEIRQSSKTGKWFAFEESSIGTYYFYECEDGYSVSWRNARTEYDTLDDLMKAIYSYASLLHIDAIHNNITNNKVKVKL